MSPQKAEHWCVCVGGGSPCPANKLLEREERTNLSLLVQGLADPWDPGGEGGVHKQQLASRSELTSG